MDFATIAMGIYTIVSPFISKGIEKIVDEAAKDGYTERKAIWDKVKGLFAQDELTLLNLFKEAETDDEKKDELKSDLKHLLKSAPETAKELETLVNTVKEIEKRNASTIINEGITGGSEVSTEVNQTTGSATENQSSITNRNIDNSKVTTKITQG
jgi:hypothetical protein